MTTSRAFDSIISDLRYRKPCEMSNQLAVSAIGDLCRELDRAQELHVKLCHQLLDQRPKNVWVRVDARCKPEWLAEVYAQSAWGIFSERDWRIVEMPVKLFAGPNVGEMIAARKAGA